MGAAHLCAPASQSGILDFSELKRFTDTEKWADQWFRKLSPEMKLFWNFLCDRCDHAGVWNPDIDLASFQIGSPIDIDAALKCMAGRITILSNGRWFIKKFVTFQYGGLNPENSAHKGVLSVFKCNGIDPTPYLQALNSYSPYVGPTKGLPRGYVAPKDKDKDKDSSGDRSAEERGEYHRESRTVLHILIEATGRHFRETDSNLEVISARLREPGVNLEGVRKMIARQCARWKGTVQEEFLRPETLFGKTKFDSYYAAGDLPISTDQPGAKPKQESIIDKQIKSLCSPR